MAGPENNLKNSKLNIISTSNHSPVARPLSYKEAVLLKADTGASAHYLAQKDMTKVGITNLKKTTMPKLVQLPTKDIMKSSHDATLNIAQVSHAAKTATVYPKITGASLLSIGQLCDDNCTAIFTKADMKVIKNNSVILEGKRNREDGLWDVKLEDIPSPSAKLNAIINKTQSKAKLASYYHACCYSPCISTLTQAVKNGNFNSWPGMEDQKLYNFMTRTMATSMGHLDQERQNLQSTKKNYFTTTNSSAQLQINSDIENDFFPTSNSFERTHDCVAQVIPFSTKNKGYMDLTGRFPYKSSRGNEYILVVYDYDSNAILAEAIKTRTASSITNGWEIIHNKLKKKGVSPNLYILDNEVSSDLKLAMTEAEVDWQLVTPYLHRANAAERAIRTFKNHLIAGLATTHPDYPVAEWDRLLEQAVITLNLLRNARVNPKLSAWAYLFGPYNFQAHPMAPPGTLVAAHAKPNKRASWAPHCRKAWYIAPSLEHYRNFKCFVPDTRAEIVTDTVDLIAHNKDIPTISHDEYVQQALMDILAVLQQKQKSNVPSLQFGEKINDAVIAVADILNKSSSKPIIQKELKLTPIDPPSDIAAAIIAQVPRVLQISPSPSKIARVEQIPIPSMINYKALAVQVLQAQAFFQKKINHIYDVNGKKETLDSLLKKNPLIWGRALSNEWGRLAQGNKYGVQYTDTIEFITKEQVPANRDVTYASFLCDERPLKSEPFRVRVVVGGDRLSFDEDAGSPATNLLETKILINSTISDADDGARFFSADLKDYFLGSPMLRPEYMKVKISKYSEDIIIQYGLREKMDINGYVYIKIKKGMYGLKQAAILAYQRLVKLMKPFGYYPEPCTTGIWSHTTRKTKFCLCVDDFGVKYFTQDDANHFLNALKSHYTISTDMQGKNYCGLTLNWNYDHNYVDISMPGYVQKQLERYQHPKPATAQYAPHRWSVPSYGKTSQQVELDNSIHLDKKQSKKVQSISGAFLYYGRAVDPTILPALSSISSTQSNPTENTSNECKMLMDYLHTYPNATIRYYKSNMVLYIDSDAAYLVLPKARSRIAGHFYFGNQPPPLPTKPHHVSTNGPIHTVCKAIRHVVSSSAEAETGAAFHNSKEGIPIRRLLTILNHPQPPDGTPFKMDNAVTTNFIHSNIRQKQSKAWDMRYQWLRDKNNLQEFRYYWDRGEHNEADYFSKHHSPSHHIQMRPKYILKGHCVNKLFNVHRLFHNNRHSGDTLRGCVAATPAYSRCRPRVSKFIAHKTDVAVLPLRHRLEQSISLCSLIN